MTARKKGQKKKPPRPDRPVVQTLAGTFWIKDEQPKKER